MENPDSILYSLLVFLLIVGIGFLGLCALCSKDCKRRRKDEHEDHYL